MVACVVFIVIVCALPLSASSEKGEADRGRRLSILILAPPLFGHLTPASALGEELVRRGHNVTLCTLTVPWSDALRKMVDRAGMSFLGVAAG